MLAGKRLIIIEDEFLIALDMQRALEAAGAAEVVLTRNFDEAAALGDGLAAFDLAILHPPPDGDRYLPVIQHIFSGGLAVLVCSAFHGAVAGTPLASAVFLDKPFADDELLAACERALAARQT